MLKKEWTAPKMSVQQVDMDKLGDTSQLSDAELKIRLEDAGYEFEKKYQASKDYIHRKIADSDVLISVGSNIANFNGYIQINDSAVSLWEQLAEPSTLEQLEKVLEDKYGISREQAVEDVIDFLNELQENNMVCVS